MNVKLRTTVLAALAAIAIPANALATSAPALTGTLDVTHDQFADNEESVGMSPNGTLLASAWNDWDYNDGCGFSYSSSSGAAWAPHTFVPGFTAFTNDPSIPGTGSFAVAGDPAVAYNPRFNTFDVVCQAFGATGGAINLLATTFNPSKADPNANENASYIGTQNPWTHPVAITTGTSNGTQKGSNGKFPDHEFITVDANPSNAHYGRLFATWAEFNGSGRSAAMLAYSDNNGTTWTGPIPVSDAQHKFDQDVRATIAPDGTVYVTSNGGPNETSLTGDYIAVAASRDGGKSFGPTVVITSLIDPVPGLLPNSNYRVFSDVYSQADADGNVTAVFNDERSGHSAVYAVRTLQPGDISSWSSPALVKASSGEQFFPWISAAPSGRLDLAFYDRGHDPNDTLNWVDYNASTNDGATWTETDSTTSGANLDKYQACLAFVQPSNCDVFFIGDYIGVVSTNTSVHILYTWNGPHAMDVYESNLS